ncbi:hypothetical protein FO519_002870 [Halicephalobus sp. NKZ332]|nr:hypothetical protein FO519_002870 [Halicephalobus sp. NKZ332]
MSSLRIIHRIGVTTSCILGFSLNSLLVYLILTTKTKELRSYSKLLLQIAICDLLGTFIIGIIQPMVVDVGKNQYMIINGFLSSTTQPLAHILCMITIFTHYFLLSSVAVQYIFRYLVICRSVKMTKKVYTSLLLFPLTMACLNISHAYFGYLPGPGDEDMGARDLNPFLLQPGENTVFIGGVMKGNAPQTFIGNIIAICIILTVYIVVVFCMYKIHSKMKTMKASFSTKTNNLQRALTKILVVQAVNPLVFQIIPTFMLNMIPDFIVGGVIATMVIIWATVSNGLVTIILIKPYREKLFLMFFKKHHIHNISRTTESTRNPNESMVPKLASVQYLDLKPCSLCCFPQTSGDYLYAVACYEQDSSGAYIGEIVLINPSTLTPVSKIGATGGVFRVHCSPENNLFYAVTTDGKCFFVDADSLESRKYSHPESPYFTDGRIFDDVIGFTSDSGRVYVVDREREEELWSTRAHRLRKAGDLECPAWSCDFLEKNTLVTTGDDGLVNIWDTRIASEKSVLSWKNQGDSGTVFVSRRNSTTFAVGDYGQNYRLFSLQDKELEVEKEVELPGGVWHVDYSLESSHGIYSVACMQGGVAVINKDFEILAHVADSKLTYGTAVHQAKGTIQVAEVEFEDKRINSFNFSLAVIMARTKKDNENSSGKKAEGLGMKKKSKARKETFSVYIHRVLKQVHPDTGISSKAMAIMNSFILDTFERVAGEASRLVQISRKNTMGSRDVQTAVRLVLPGELSKHAVSEGTKAKISLMNKNFLIFLPVYSIIISFVYFYHHEGILDNISVDYGIIVSGRWKKGYCIYGNVLKREKNANDVISLVLHSSQDRIDRRIAEQVSFLDNLLITNGFAAKTEIEFYNKSQNYISLAVVLERRTPDSVSCSFKKTLSIWSRVKSHLSVHFLIPSSSRSCPNLEFLKNKGSLCSSTSTVPSLNISRIVSYPANFARNVARSFVDSEFILIADLDHFFSEFFELKMRSLAKQFFKDKENRKTVLVYRIFEVENDRPREPHPLTKEQLKNLLKNEKAREFHSGFGNGHKIPYLQDWLKEDSEGIQFYNDYSSSDWEPQFVSLTSIPLHDEAFLYPSKDNTVLRWEMCRSNFTFAIVFNHFMYHRGFKPLKVHRLLDKARMKIRKQTKSAYLAFNRRMDLLYPETIDLCPKPRL